MDRSVRTFLLTVAAGALILSPAAYVRASQEQDQQSQPAPDDQQAQKSSKKSGKDKQKNDNQLKKELESPYRKWLDEDVVYIISPEERHSFLHLATNEEREQFIEAFWQRRNPDPDSPENTFKEEHYRRIAYANEHYASGIPGWKTDRGKIYIRPVETGTVRWTRAAGRPLPTLGSRGGIGTSMARAWARTSSWNS
jgi:GWxTD domain-containing protein